MTDRRDREIIRALARTYAAAAAEPVQDERRALWSDHYSLRRTRPMVLCLWVCAMWEIIDPLLECEDPFLRGHERWLRSMLFQDGLGDDLVLEPWITQRAAFVDSGFQEIWGLKRGRIPSPDPRGAWKNDPSLKSLDDFERMVKPAHVVDEPETERRVSRLGDAVGDILEIHVDRTPVVHNFANALGRLRGLEHLMMDMHDNPGWLHEVLAFMRDGVLESHLIAEREGHWTAADHSTYVMGYADGIAAPCANGPGLSRKDLFAWFDAQEYAQVSPAMHDEFMLQFQIPIMEAFGLTHYGCCEDLTHKIDILRQVPNLRRIAVSPWSDIARCADQIRDDYVISWHPNPTDMGCCGFDPEHVSDIIRDGMEKMSACHVDIVFKDVNTVEGDPDRLREWVRIVREASEAVAA